MCVNTGSAVALLDAADATLVCLVDLKTELDQDVVCAFDNRGSVANQGVTAAIAAAQGIAGHRHHLATLLERAAGSDERPRFVRRLDHDHGA
jgi:hypothetical protein